MHQEWRATTGVEDGRSEGYTPRGLARKTGVRHSRAIGVRARPEPDLHERRARVGVDGRGVDGRASGDVQLAEGEEDLVLRMLLFDLALTISKYNKRKPTVKKMLGPLMLVVFAICSCS